MKKYNPAAIEKKWQKIWEEKKLYKTPSKSSKPKYYCLDMFPYPSGAGLHIGHPKGYTATDIISRYKRAKGFNVLHPMGWDAFGLPAENDAVKRKVNPNKLVPENTKHFKKQCQMLGLSCDWDREIDTSRSEYYRWTQWLFLKMFEKGLLYRKNVPINWCPRCKTGLADEEAQGGKCDRCGGDVTKKDMKQWLFKITEYADCLLEDLDKEDLDWPEAIVKMQKAWIGRSEGVEIDFSVKGQKLKITTFTTRPDTIYGVTFMVIAPEYKDLEKLVTKEQSDAVARYVEVAKGKSELQRISEIKDKTGVFTGSYGINPLDGEEFPIWVADYVVASYGTGAVMGVPAYDERDKAFIEKYKLCFKDIPLEGMKEITEKIVSELCGRKAVSYHLRDWIFSRQRYWGEPFPLIHCEKCGVVPVPYKDLPVELPYVGKYEPLETGESPLAAVSDWVNTSCPKCGGTAKRETDTMPNWAGSCWYFLRFIDPHNDKEPFSKDLVAQWMPVDWYVGGAEHAVLHLLYARFWVKVFYDLGLISFKEPFKKLRNVGLIMGSDGKKISKSAGNGPMPEEIIEKYGADTLRLYEMFLGPFEQSACWSETGILGISRFLNKVWSLPTTEEETSPEIKKALNKLIKKVEEDIENMKFNTAIAAFMEFVNKLSAPASGGADVGFQLSAEDSRRFLILLAPFAPHITEELWEAMGEAFSVHNQPWPGYDSQLSVEERVIVAVQVNGKTRDTVEVVANAPKEKVLKAARDSKAGKYLNGVSIVKEIVVPNKVVNFVTASSPAGSP
jgi:leucyl-tRNA synthetase